MNMMRGFSCRSDVATAVLCRSMTTTGSRATVVLPRGRVLHPPTTPRRHHHHHHHQRPALFVTSNEKYMRLVQTPRPSFRDYSSSLSAPAAAAAARRSSKTLLFAGGCSAAAASLAVAPIRKGGGGDGRRREKARKPPAAAAVAAASSALSSSNTHHVFQVIHIFFILSFMFSYIGSFNLRWLSLTKWNIVWVVVCVFRRRQQVVVMRVSLHCQGCASKVKKHLSKMEGIKIV